MTCSYSDGPRWQGHDSSSKPLFGDAGLFDCRNMHVADQDVGPSKYSDWDVVMNRINWLINNSTVKKITKAPSISKVI